MRCGSCYGQCPIKCSARDFEQVGYALAVMFAFLNQLAGVVELLRGEFALSSEFNPTALGGFDPGAGVFADQAALKIGKKAYHLPHGAAGRRVGVYVFRKRTEFNPSTFQVVEHCYQVAQAPAQTVELPHNQGVAGFEFLYTAE
jgi:hypothetical protein